MIVNNFHGFKRKKKKHDNQLLFRWPFSTYKTRYFYIYFTKVSTFYVKSHILRVRFISFLLRVWKKKTLQGIKVFSSYLFRKVLVKLPKFSPYTWYEYVCKEHGSKSFSQRDSSFCVCYFEHIVQITCEKST